jgi:hypothetical protein
MACQESWNELRSSVGIHSSSTGFPSSSSVECWSSDRILRIPIESRLSSPSSVAGFRLVGIPAILPRSG